MMHAQTTSPIIQISFVAMEKKILTILIIHFIRVYKYSSNKFKARSEFEAKKAVEDAKSG